MKKVKILASAVAVLTIAGAALAFAPKKNPANLFQRLKAFPNTCSAATATSGNTGTIVTPPSTHTGFYTNNQCIVGQEVTGYQPDAQ